ncbi:hypothetical protein AVEN_182528-1 [Araneus ventricosus]|uniref:Uncharacterized protein n=1 Tax=Araneus ventricosus TaxID=182803 RepID=A0A4Y2BYS7_ARAVE|nr:hypothetical protein AVEN_182528-1 [Araneus ventricosus]
MDTFARFLRPFTFNLNEAIYTTTVCVAGMGVHVGDIPNLFSSSHLSPKRKNDFGINLLLNSSTSIQVHDVLLFRDKCAVILDNYILILMKSSVFAEISALDK